MTRKCCGLLQKRVSISLFAMAAMACWIGLMTVCAMWKVQQAEQVMKSLNESIQMNEIMKSLNEDVSALPTENGRQLAGFHSVAEWATAGPTTGCVIVELNTDVTLDLSTKPCNGNRCPPCFIFTAGNDFTNKLTLQGCSTMYVSATRKMGDTTPDMQWDNAVQQLVFMNKDQTKKALIEDGQGDLFILRPQGAASAMCYRDGSSKLFWMGASSAAPARYVFNVDNTNACPAGTQRITTAAMCRWAYQSTPPCNALANMGVNGPAIEGVSTGGICGSSNQQITSANVPKGCVYCSDDNEFSFNDHATGGTLAKYFPVCLI